MRQLPNKKAPDIERIAAELLKPVPVRFITALCQEIWCTCKWPKDWTRSVFIPLSQKGDARDCSNYRTIAMIPPASKILLTIIQQWLQQVVDQELLEAQVGSRKGRCTRVYIAPTSDRLLKRSENTRKICTCVSLITVKLLTALSMTSSGWPCVTSTSKLPSLSLLDLCTSIRKQTVRTLYGDTDWFRIGKGVRQDCILSPVLFNLYAKAIMRKLDLHSSNIEVKIGGRIINNLRFVDDTTLLAKRVVNLKNVILEIKQESDKMGLHLNIKKTKIMTTAAIVEVKFRINDEEIESVQDFIFLGSKINCGGESTSEIKHRITFGRTAIAGVNKIWKSKDITLTAKSRLVNAIIFPMLMYGCASWTQTMVDKRRINAFEIWC